MLNLFKTKSSLNYLDNKGISPHPHLPFIDIKGSGTGNEINNSLPLYIPLHHNGSVSNSTHYSGFTREWYNSIYSYNKNYVKDLVYKDNLVKHLFQSYFSIKFLNKKQNNTIQIKRIKGLRFSNNKILLSKSEIKHTNSKVIINLFIFNNNNRIILKKLKNLYYFNIFTYIVKKFKKKLLILYKLRKNNKVKNYKRITSKTLGFLNKIKSMKLKNKNFKFWTKVLTKMIQLKKVKILEKQKKQIMHPYLQKVVGDTLHSSSNNLVSTELKDTKNKVLKKTSLLKKSVLRLKKSKILNKFFYKTLKNLIKLYIFNENKISNNLKGFINLNLLPKYNSTASQLTNNHYYSYVVKVKKLKIKIKRLISYLYYNQMLMFNKFKFTYLFLNYKGFGLINILSKIYNKRVEFNIINLKSVHLNSDILTQSMAVKISNRKNNLLRILKKALKTAKWEKSLHSSYTELVPMVQDSTFTALQCSPNKGIENTTYSNSINKAYRPAVELKKINILKHIQYKNISGVRFEVAGRLSKRLIASKSMFKVRYKGSLKNIYSSYKGMSSPLLRGYAKSSLQYTLISSKTANGAFGLKGWINNF